MVPSLFNVPQTEREFLIFSFANQAHHNDIQSAMLAQNKGSLPIVVLDPLPLFDLQSWLRRHQDLHNQQNQLLGIIGNDLTDVDMRDPKQLVEWIEIHASEHLQAAGKLGVF